MKYYKDLDNKVFAYSADGSQDEYIPNSHTRITVAEADKLRQNNTVNDANTNKLIASMKLSETDWAVQPDVVNSKIFPHLSNHAEYTKYRAKLRAIAINPSDGNIKWPIKPAAVWKTK